jgi:hypothetical protein
MAGGPARPMSRCPKRHLLSVAHGLRMAPAATPVSPMGYGLSSLAELGALWNLGAIAPPNVVIMDGQSVKTTERGGVRGFDGYKRAKGRKRHILVGTLGIMIANRVAPANMSDRRAGTRLLGGLGPLFPRIHTVIADAGHQSRQLARDLLRQEGWKLQIVRRRQRAFQIL